MKHTPSGPSATLATAGAVLLVLAAPALMAKPLATLLVAPDEVAKGSSYDVGLRTKSGGGIVVMIGRDSAPESAAQDVVVDHLEILSAKGGIASFGLGEKVRLPDREVTLRVHISAAAVPGETLVLVIESGGTTWVTETVRIVAV